MKALIWIGCIFSYALCTVMIKNAGITLGGIPTAIMFGGVWWLATTLCKKYDSSQKQNDESDEDESEQ